MVNNKNEAMPMKLVSKDTTNQAMSKMVVKLTNYKEETTARTKPESAIRSQDHLCTPVKKSRPLTRMLSSKTGKIGQSRPKHIQEPQMPQLSQ